MMILSNENKKKTVNDIKSTENAIDALKFYGKNQLYCLLKHYYFFGFRNNGKFP